MGEHPIARLIPLIDLTDLSENCTEQDILKLCSTAQTPFGTTAAICIYPRWIKSAKPNLPAEIKIATVVNFPTGTQTLKDVQSEIEFSLQQGADEIDLVFPYQKFLSGDFKYAEKFIHDCRILCPSIVSLKVILETGVFENYEELLQASLMCIHNGCDFLKTSTGKIEKGASLEAVDVFCKAIKQTASNRCGIKISGGLKTPEQIWPYLDLIESYFGSTYISAQNFRIGASSLLSAIINDVKHAHT